ncbi:MAG: hypothetical protein KIS94_12340 [Chitinophagales bacterium]|nr:hypothetical protein [Chitinophagales bacterium]
MRTILCSVLLLTILIFSCNKRYDLITNESNDHLLITLKQINSKYYNSKSAEKHTRQLGTFYGLMTDIFTGCGAASLTAASGPGAVAFGVAVGTYFSSMCRANGNFTTDDPCQNQTVQYLYDGTPAYDILIGQTYWDIYTNTEYQFQYANNFDDCGIFHNLVIKQGECTTIFQNGNAAMYDSIVQLITLLDNSVPSLNLSDTFLIVYRSTVLSIAEDFESLNPTDSNYRANLTSLLQTAGLYGNNRVYTILNTYIDGIEGIGMSEYQNFSDYHKDFVIAIQNSTQLTTDQKNAIYSILALGKFSYFFWSYASQNN